MHRPPLEERFSSRHSGQDLDIIFDRIGPRAAHTNIDWATIPIRAASQHYRTIKVKVLDNYKARHLRPYLTGPQKIYIPRLSCLEQTRYCGRFGTTRPNRQMVK